MECVHLQKMHVGRIRVSRKSRKVCLKLNGWRFLKHVHERIVFECDCIFLQCRYLFTNIWRIQNLFHKFQCWLLIATWFWITSKCFSCSLSLLCWLIWIEFPVGIWQFPWFRHWRPWWNYCSSPNVSTCWKKLVRPVE